jgi:glycosyltransferase involved in cell wall biosynthesis
MNILQIIDTCCPPDNYNRADGTTRVVTQLCHYYVNTCQDTCYIGYFHDNEINVVAPEFSDSIKLTLPIDTEELSLFIEGHAIDIIQYNVPGKQYMQLIPTISKVAHAQHIPMVYCFHFMPGREWCDYGTFDEVMFAITHQESVKIKFKHWLITKYRPLCEKIAKFKIRKKYNFAYRNCDKIVLFVESYIDKYLDIIGGGNRNKFIAIPNPLTYTDFLAKDKVRAKDKEVVIVGRLSEGQKRISIALQIWQLIEKNPLLNEWTLKIVGYGEDDAFYHSLANKYHLKHVSFEGHQDPRPYYKRAAIMISTAGYEGWPMVFMEAMPMGCCCLSFDSYDAIHSIIENGYNGRIIPDYDIKEYVNNLTELMLDNELRIKMGINAIDSSSRFTMEKIGAEWRALLEELV